MVPVVRELAYPAVADAMAACLMFSRRPCECAEALTEETEVQLVSGRARRPV
jgi:hypothetical protein